MLGDIFLLAFAVLIFGVAGIFAFLEAILWFGLNPGQRFPARCLVFLLKCFAVLAVALGAAGSALQDLMLR